MTAITFDTRTDMLRLEHKFDLIANELKLHRWILAIIAAGVLLPAIRQLF